MVPAHAHFDGNWYRYSLYRCFNKACRQGQIPHQGRASITVHNFFNGTPHVNVNYRRATIFIQLRRLTHFIGCATSKLHGNRFFNCVPFAFLNALPRFADHSLTGDHLGHV